MFTYIPQQRYTNIYPTRRYQPTIQRRNQDTLDSFFYPRRSLFDQIFEDELDLENKFTYNNPLKQLERVQKSRQERSNTSCNCYKHQQDQEQEQQDQETNDSESDSFEFIGNNLLSLLTPPKRRLEVQPKSSKQKFNSSAKNIRQFVDENGNIVTISKVETNDNGKKNKTTQKQISKNNKLIFNKKWVNDDEPEEENYQLEDFNQQQQIGNSENKQKTTSKKQINELEKLLNEMKNSQITKPQTKKYVEKQTKNTTKQDSKNNKPKKRSQNDVLITDEHSGESQWYTD